MNWFSIPWLSLAITIPWIGAIAVSWMRDPFAAYSRSCIAAGLTTLCSFFAWLGFYLGAASSRWDWLSYLCGPSVFSLDELNAPLLPAISLVHFLTILTTARSKMGRMSFSLLLICESIRLAIFSCMNLNWLVVLLIACVFVLYLVMRSRQQPSRLYLIHIVSFAAFLLLGWSMLDLTKPEQPTIAILSLLIAVLIRSGTFPAHLWVMDLFERVGFGTGLLLLCPLTGTYAAIRLVLPFAPDWMLSLIGYVSLLTALYAACMTCVQNDARRFLAYLFLSNSALVLVGLELHTQIALTGSLSLWFSVILALTGLGLTLRSVESRFGRLTLDRFQGLYDHSPTLAVCFLLTGLASVGFPGTIGFISAELLVDGAVEENALVGLVVVAVAALNGIAIVRAYFRIFTGQNPGNSLLLGIRPRERFAVLLLTFLIIGGGLWPQPGVKTRFIAAKEILATRRLAK